MIKNTIKVGSILGLIMALLIYGLNLYIIRSYDDRILTIEEIESMVLEEDYEAYDCIMVLGAGVWSDGDPSIMLSDRLDQGIVLYINEASDRLLMSGDHGRVNYDEVNVMKQYAIDRGIEADHIFMDHAGFSTYESMVRAKKVFGVKRMIVVTQGYHMYRALFIANELGIEADGFTADLQPYYKQRNRDIREVFARVKDYFYVVIEPEPTYLGDPIPITGLGSQTDDQ